VRAAYRPLVLSVLAALVIAGCGGGKSSPKHASDAQAVSKVVKRYLSALAAGDGDVACGLMTKSYQDKLVSGSPSNCAKTFDTLAYQLDASEKATLTGAKITSAKVTGDRARVRVKGQKGAAALTKTGGVWLISGGTAAS
jgi:hypothetical protein